MTPAQQSSLEALAGRVMTAGEIGMAQGRADSSLAASLSVGRTLPGSVSTPILTAWCSATGLRAVIEDAASNATSPMRNGALAIRDLLSWATGSLDLSASRMGQGNLAMLGAWVSAGIVTPAQRDNLIALAATPTPVDCNSISAILNG